MLIMVQILAMEMVLLMIRAPQVMGEDVDVIKGDRKDVVGGMVLPTWEGTLAVMEHSKDVVIGVTPFEI